MAFILFGLIPACMDKAVKKEAGLQVLNVLDKDLFDDCHIKGSRQVDFDAVDAWAQGVSPEADIVVYCSNYQCTTSDYVAKQLKKQGFDKVSVYEGGMAEWFQEGLPVEGPCTKPYLKKPLKKNEFIENSDIPIISVSSLAEKMGYTV